MVRELTDKHLAAINRGRKAKGLKPIRRKKTETKKKTTTKKATKKSKFEKTRKKSDMVAGVDYFKSYEDLLGSNKKTQRKLKKNGGKNA